MTLDVTALGNATGRLQEGLDVDARAPAQSLLRNGLIQRFVYTIGCCFLFNAMR